MYGNYFEEDVQILTLVFGIVLRIAFWNKMVIDYLVNLFMIVVMD